MLLDAGPSGSAGRILAFMKQNGIRQIDRLVVSHFEGDHMGAVPQIVERVPVRHVVDHGDSVVYGKDDEWWKQRRSPWFRQGMGKAYDQSFDVYRKARDKSQHVVVKAGDRVPVKGLDVDVVSAGGKIIKQPMKGGGGAGVFCRDVDRRADDDAEDGQSVGVVVRDGKFRFVYLGDLTWNTANSLFCPENLIGSVDAYLVTHHAHSLPKDLGPYYHGVSSCPPSEVHGLQPRAAILSMGGHGHRDGMPDAMKVLHSVPGMDLWQTEFIRDGAEKGYNGPEPFVANLGERSEPVPYIEIVANADGSFKVTNSRNGFVKRYPPRN